MCQWTFAYSFSKLIIIVFNFYKTFLQANLLALMFLHCFATKYSGLNNQTRVLFRLNC